MRVLSHCPRIYLSHTRYELLDLHGRPNIPEYSQIADHIRQALDEVYYGLKNPKQALDDAAAKSAKTLGW